MLQKTRVVGRCFSPCDELPWCSSGSHKISVAGDIVQKKSYGGHMEDEEEVNFEILMAMATDTSVMHGDVKDGIDH